MLNVTRCGIVLSMLPVLKGYSWNESWCHTFCLC